MGSFWHILKPNKRLFMPTKIVVVDTETEEIKGEGNASKHKLKLGYAVYLERKKGGSKYKEEWFYFDRKSQFWAWFLSKITSKSKVYLLAHNQHFDFMVLDGFTMLTKNGFTLKRNIIDSHLFIATFRSKSATIEVLDTLNWFKTSIEKLGEVLGLPKLKIDFKKCSIEELKTYCKRDVDILKETVLNWLSFLIKYDLGNFQPTLASQAFTAYKHRFMKHEIYIHAHPKATILERASYRGGRVEAFFLGEVEGKIYDLDFNSLYPSVMIDNEFPVKFLRYMDKTTVEDLKRILKRYCIVARVKIKIDKPFIAVKKERLIFPVGVFWAVLTTPELKEVFRSGEILEVRETAIYEKAPIFKEYVTALYNMRTKFKAKNNALYDINTKLLLNSLYGKFGQRVEDTTEIGETGLDDVSVEIGIVYETNQRYVEYSFGGKVYRRFSDKKEWRDAFPAIASHVTAYARLKLWQAIETAGVDNVYYVDTDSLFINEKGFKSLQTFLDPAKLGYLKIEKEGSKLYVYGCKDYVLDDITKIKGVKKNAKKLKKGVYEQTRFYKFRSLLRKNSLDAPISETYVKNLKREYKKGIVKPNGRVIPFSLFEL